MRNLKNHIKKYKKIHNAAISVKSALRKKGFKSTEESNYSIWIEEHEPKLWNKSRKIKQPKISVVVPAFNTPDKYLLPLIESLNDQLYSNWELCIADASTDNDRIEAIKKVSDTNSRVKYIYNKGFHISDNTNAGISIATGDYIALLDHDDTLSLHALDEVVAEINKNNPDVIYSDEDKITDDGKERLLPFFKPDWSPDLLLGVNYITHFLVVKKSFLDKIGYLRSGFDGAQDYDLILRLTEQTDKISHIPKILYHWRLADGSTAKSVGEKNYADNAGQEALREAVSRRKVKAKVVEITDRPTNYRLKYELPKVLPKVSIIIPFKDKPELLKQCVDSIIGKTTYDNYEIILISNNSTQQDTKHLVDELIKSKHIKAYEWNYPFNYSKINNYGVSKTTGEYIVLLNNDTEVITTNWLKELIGVASQPRIGAVGPLLLYPDRENGIQHAGVVLGMNTMAGHVFRHRQPEEWTDFGIPLWPRNYLAVTAACLAVSKNTYLKAGGLDETFTVAGNDVAFCLSLHEAGYRNVYWPFASLYHYESVSVGTYNNGIQLDYDHSLKYYKRYHEVGDPYFNKNLDLMNENVGVKGV